MTKTLRIGSVSKADSGGKARLGALNKEPKQGSALNRYAATEDFCFCRDTERSRVLPPQMTGDNRSYVDFESVSRLTVSTKLLTSCRAPSGPS